MKGRPILAIVGFAMICAAMYSPSASAQDSAQFPGPFKVWPSDKRILVEWAAASLGGGYISYTNSYGKAAVSVFTVGQENWYYTLFEADVFFSGGALGLSQRAGYQKFIGDGWAVRVGLKLGLDLWNETLGCWYAHEGVDIAPHVQFILFFKHGSIGIGLDVPILVSTKIVGGTSCAGCNDPQEVFGGAQLYLRGSVF